MPYQGSTIVTGGLIQKNDNTWPVADAKDIYFEDNLEDPKGYTSLKDQVTEINDQITEIGEAASPETINGLIDTKIEDIDVEDSAIENQFVTAVSQADGKVSITRTQPTIDNVSGLPDEISGIKARLDDLEYVPMAISSFTVSPSKAEIGSTQTSATLTWTITPAGKNPVTQAIDSESVAVNLRTITKTELSITSDKTFTLVVKDNRDLQVSKTAKMAFMNKAYWGASAAGTYNSAFVLALSNSDLTASKARTINVTAGANKYIYYAIPASFGTPTFTVGGFSGGFELASTFNFTNESGYTVSYNLYKSNNANLGATTVVIS